MILNMNHLDPGLTRWQNGGLHAYSISGRLCLGYYGSLSFAQSKIRTYEILQAL
jgi:hypothetical protein